MNYKHFVFFSLFIPSITQSMHIKDLSTVVGFDGVQKSLFEWIRDDRNKSFGETPIYHFGKGKLQQKSTVETIEMSTLDKIALGKAIYCTHVIYTGYKDRGHIILCCKKNSDIIDDTNAKMLDNLVRLQILKNLYEKDRERHTIVDLK